MKQDPTESSGTRRAVIPMPLSSAGDLLGDYSEWTAWSLNIRDREKKKTTAVYLCYLHITLSALEPLPFLLPPCHPFHNVYSPLEMRRGHGIRILNRVFVSASVSSTFS